MKKNKMYLQVSPDDQDVAYLYLPAHPGEDAVNCVSKQLTLSDNIKDYKGPEIYLDFNHEGELIGIEVLI